LESTGKIATDPFFKNSFLSKDPVQPKEPMAPVIKNIKSKFKKPNNMKKFHLLVLLTFPVFLNAQIGLKAGLNYANVTNASSINSSHSSGFMVAVFLAPKSKGIISYTTEIGFSQQGYDYKTNSNTGSVKLNYIVMPHLLGINITKFFQLQVGGQTAYLLNAKADSSKTTPTGNPAAKTIDYYNRFDYGAAAGLEIHPLAGLIIGARYNISFGDLYKNAATANPSETPSFIPNVNAKNNVVQIFAGWKFGKSKSKRKK
jgi:Outer membrane protein beta-barrel domain